MPNDLPGDGSALSPWYNHVYVMISQRNRRRIPVPVYSSGFGISMSITQRSPFELDDHVGFSTFLGKSFPDRDSCKWTQFTSVVEFGKFFTLGALEISFSNSLIIHTVISQSECPILNRCMYLDTQWTYRSRRIRLVQKLIKKLEF